VSFSTNPQLELIMATFATEERLTFLNIDNSVGTIIKLVDAGELYVKKAIQWRLEFGDGMKRVEVPEVRYEFKREKLGFTVVFYRPKNLVLDSVTGKVVGGNKLPANGFTVNFTENFTENELQLLAIIAANADMTTDTMAEQLGVTRRTVATRLKSLKEKGAVLRVGSDKKGRWKIVRPEFD
jgi:biotin operon repressor